MKLGTLFSRADGFTLVEMMVTVAIAAILAAVAVPMLSGFLARSQMNAVVNDFTGALQYARMEAVSRNRCVSVCRRAEAKQSCAAADGSWSAGWLVFENPNCSSSVDATDPPAGTLLRARDPGPESMAINAETGDAPEVIVFTPRGIVLDGFTTMVFTDKRGSNGAGERLIAVSRSGRVVATKRKEASPAGSGETVAAGSE